MNGFKLQIGIMQGRLTEPKERGIQFFPFENWKKEFILGKEIGINEIEFIFDYDRYLSNPLWNAPERIQYMIASTGIQVNAVCFDYFMRRPFYKFSGDEKTVVLQENTHIIKKIIHNMRISGIKLIEIPLVDNSSLKTESEAIEFQRFLLTVINEVGEGIKFGLETDLPPNQFREYIDSFNNNAVGANYDTGNSSGLGYNPYEEILSLKEKIFNIHIKDRVYRGQSVQLGTGSADFENVFRAINEINYTGNFILQAARGEEGKEKENIIKQIDFLRKYIQ